MISRTDLLELNNLKNMMNLMMVGHGRAQQGVLFPEDLQNLRQLPPLQRRKSTFSVSMMIFLLLLPTFQMVKAKESRLLPPMMMISMTSKVRRRRPLRVQLRVLRQFHPLYLPHLLFNLIPYDLVVSLLPPPLLHSPT